MIQTLNAPKPCGPYSQGVKAGNFIFVSGQDGVQPNGESAGESISEQTAASLENIKNVLAEKGAKLSDIVYATCHLSELNQGTVQEFNSVYESYFKDVEVKPARITVGSQLLGVKVEISAIAAVN
ncbi:Rid family detoxifying hydrolase [Virgibacillus necropolis]|uniref:Rid family detoxifying hydrolase n=1 Tax=Virgibacillus necropolis TaxID=163877 RepID=UPI00384AA31C